MKRCEIYIMMQMAHYLDRRLLVNSHYCIIFALSFFIVYI